MNARTILVAVLGILTLRGSAWALEGMVSHWKFDEGSGAIAYDSAGTNDGTINDATWTTGQINGALSFNGVGDYVDCASDMSLNDINSVSFWFKPETKSGYVGAIISQYGTNADRWVFSVYEAANGLYLFSDGYDLLNSDPGSVSPGNWYHAAITWDGSIGKMYVDGIQQTETTTTSFFDVIDPEVLSIGINFYSSIPSISYGFNGKIDDVMIFDRALSAEEVQQLYRKGKAFAPHPADAATNVDPNVVLSWSPGIDANSHNVYLGTAHTDVNEATPDSNEYMGNFSVNSYDPCGLELETTYYWRIDEVADSNIHKGDVWSFKTYVEPNLISWWKFDEGEGIVAYDSAGTNHGFIYGADWTTGQIDGALSFDGVGDYVDCASDMSLNNINSVSFWFKPETKSGYLGSIISQYGTNADRWVFTVDEAATVLQVWVDGYLLLNSDAGSVSPGNWYHAAITWEGSIGKMYVDGIQQTETITTSIFDVLDPEVFSIGIHFYSSIPSTPYGFNGKIDDVMIFDRALSAEEIWDIYVSYLAEPQDIDIKPGSCPNPLNVKRLGLLPVAVLGSEDFDVSSIDVASIRLASVAPIRSSYEDVATPVSDSNECECSTEGPDGFLDLTLKFETQTIVEAIGEVDHDDELMLELTGVLSDETHIEGSDCVIILGKHKPLNRADFNGDGIVDMADFAAFAENWLQSSIVEY